MESKSTIGTIRKCLDFTWKTNRNVFLILVAFSIIQNAMVYVQFISFASIVNAIVKLKQDGSATDELFFASIVLVFSFLVPTVLTNAGLFYRGKFRRDNNYQLTVYKIEKQSLLDIGTIESSSYQNLLRSAKEWGTDSISNVQDFIFITVGNIFGIFISLGVLWSLSPWLVLFSLLAAAPIYQVYKKYSIEVFRIRKAAIEDYRFITNRVAHFEEFNKAVDTVLLNLKDWLKDQISSRIKTVDNSITTAERKKTISYSLLSLWYLIFLFAAIALIAWETIHGQIPIGGLILAFTTYTKFYQTINGLVESISGVEDASRYAARWFELFSIQPKIKSNANDIAPKFAQPPLIEFKNVSFKYPDETIANPYVLENISFSILPGQKVAIVGANGSGKTTLIKLLSRVYDPTEGSILVNGRDLRDINLAAWQNSLGILLQDFPVYNVTFREAIKIGDVSSVNNDSNERLKVAAQSSGSDEFIKDYDRLVWKGYLDGIELSKGQHQRLSVARIFYRNAPITILDEPTASVDVASEEKIFDTIKTKMTDKTVILITHRFNTLQYQDNIFLFDQGKIIEQGSHKNLMLQNKEYARLFKTQADRYGASVSLCED